MRELTVEAVLGTTVDVAVCMTCRAFWFEPFETLHLTRQSTLELFRLISSDTARGPFPRISYCPLCRAKLLFTHDRQKTTPFEYWRCDAGHGRFTPFIDFLREKDFVKPLTPAQVADLRQSVQIIRCSGCGGSIDLAHDTVCAHCGAQVSMLDLTKLRELAPPSPAMPAAPAPPHPTLEQHMPTLLASHPPLQGPIGVADLVDAGLAAVGRWLQEIGEP